jgi:hypothetical protein
MDPSCGVYAEDHKNYNSAIFSEGKQVRGDLAAQTCTVSATRAALLPALSASDEQQVACTLCTPALLALLMH